MKYIDRVSNFFTNKKRSKIIDNIIEREVSITRDFGLNIEKEHIEKEHYIIRLIFLELWDDIINNPTNYNMYRKNISNYIHQYLESELKYYFDVCKDHNVKNKYNCHITAILDNLMLTISNYR